MTGRVRCWNSLVASEIQLRHVDAVERRRFRQFLTVNELSESNLLFLKKHWMKNRADHESIFRFMERLGWLKEINEHSFATCVEEFGFEVDEFPRNHVQLAEVGVQALRNGMQSDSLLDAIYRFFGRRHASVTTLQRLDFAVVDQARFP